MLGTLFIGLIVAGWAALAARSLWRNRKSACSCGGSCATCGGCAQGRSPQKSCKAHASAE